MAFKLVVFSCLLALAYGSVAPAVFAGGNVLAKLEEFDPYPQYRYGYNVDDALTGDQKSQNEERNGDVVTGQYSLAEADGTVRIVDYIADSVNGFNARVQNVPRTGLVAEPAVIPARIAAAPVAAAPIAPARYIATAPAPVFTNYAAAAPVAAVAPARYAVGPAAAPVVAARYATAPAYTYAAAPYTAAYSSPYAAAYTAPFSTAAVSQYSTGPVTAYAQYRAPLEAAYAQYSTPLAAAYSAFPTAFAAPAAAYRAPVSVTAAKLVEAAPAAAAGYRYP